MVREKSCCFRALSGIGAQKFGSSVGIKAVRGSVVWPFFYQAIEIAIRWFIVCVSSASRHA